MEIRGVNSFEKNNSDEIREIKSTQDDAEVFDFEAESYDEQQAVRKQQFYKDFSSASTDAERDLVVANYDYETKKADLLYDYSFIDNPTDEDMLQFRASLEYIEESHDVDVFKIEQQARDDQYTLDYAQAKTDSERNLVTQKYEYESARAAVVFNYSRIENPTDEQRTQYEQELKDLDSKNDKAVYNIQKQARDEQYTKDLVNAWQAADRAKITEEYKRDTARAELVFNFSQLENPTDQQREEFLAKLDELN